MSKRWIESGDPDWTVDRREASGRAGLVPHRVAAPSFFAAVASVTEQTGHCASRVVIPSGKPSKIPLLRFRECAGGELGSEQAIVCDGAADAETAARPPCIAVWRLARLAGGIRTEFRTPMRAAHAAWNLGSHHLERLPIAVTSSDLM